MIDFFDLGEDLPEGVVMFEGATVEDLKKAFDHPDIIYGLYIERLTIDQKFYVMEQLKSDAKAAGHPLI